MTRPKLTPRKITLNTDSIPRYWAAGMVYPTHFRNAISLSFPLLEKHAVLILRAAVKEVDDAELIETIRLFCLQENNHSSLHNSFNKIVFEDPPQQLVALEKLTSWAKVLKKRPMNERVALVLAFEHCTAASSRLLLNALPAAIESGLIHPEALKIWSWHCAEEIEHHHVAWEVAHALGIDKKTLNRALVEFLQIFYPYVFSASYELIKLDKQQRKVKTWLQASVFLARHFSRMSPYLLSFFKPAFDENYYAALDTKLLSDWEKLHVEYEIAD